MSHPKLENVNIESVVLLATPREMKRAVPQTSASIATVTRGRETIERVLEDEDHRLLAIVGPCSIHHLESAETYARKLKQLSDEIADTICVVMRVYFEKPRSVLGWKGLINDPDMNDTFHIEEGIRMARHFLMRVAEIGLPAATEVLETLMPQYIGDLISYSVIGARTAEAQTHREIASGMSTPVGFKNSTDGSLVGAINGIHAAMGYHHFLGVTEDGLPAVFSTTGNPTRISCCARETPQLRCRQVFAFCEAALRTARLPVQIIVDCSHGIPKSKPDSPKAWCCGICSRRSNRATAPSEGSCSRASWSGAANPCPRIPGNSTRASPSPMPVSIGKPRKSCCAKPATATKS